MDFQASLISIISKVLQEDEKPAKVEKPFELELVPAMEDLPATTDFGFEFDFEGDV